MRKFSSYYDRKAKARMYIVQNLSDHFIMDTGFGYNIKTLINKVKTEFELNEKFTMETLVILQDPSSKLKIKLVGDWIYEKKDKNKKPVLTPEEEQILNPDSK